MNVKTWQDHVQVIFTTNQKKKNYENKFHLKIFERNIIRTIELIYNIIKYILV